MRKIFFSLICFCVFVVQIFLNSCASRKDIVFFQSDSTILDTVFARNSPKLQPGDILAISVTADNLKATQAFNQISAYQEGTIQSTNPFIPTYTIDDNGEVDFPQIGRIKLSGLTRTEALTFLKNEVSRFIVNPGISISIRNFRITVLGEVARPGSFLIDNDRISLLEALGLAGDMNINGIRNNVLVIRENNGTKQEFRIDLTKRESLNSPVYYLKQNDVVYVEPNGAKIQSSKYTQNTSIFVSIAGLIITIIAVIIK